MSYIMQKLLHSASALRISWIIQYCDAHECVIGCKEGRARECYRRRPFPKGKMKLNPPLVFAKLSPHDSFQGYPAHLSFCLARLHKAE